MEKAISNPEESKAYFEEWLNNLSVDGVVGEIEPEVLLGVLESMGANFEISEEAKTSLGRYSNKNKRKGLDEVWGKEKIDLFKRWVIGEYIPLVEKRVGRELHTLWDPKTETYDDIKHSGMMQFVGELSAYSAGIMAFSDYKRLTEDRIRKGKKWEHGDPYEPYKPSRHSSFPEDFPVKAVAWLKAENKANTGNLE